MSRLTRNRPCAWCGEPTAGKPYYFTSGLRLCVMQRSGDTPTCGDVFLSRSIERERNRVPKLPKGSK